MLRSCTASDGAACDCAAAFASWAACTAWVVWAAGAVVPQPPASRPVARTAAAQLVVRRAAGGVGNEVSVVECRAEDSSWARAARPSSHRRRRTHARYGPVMHTVGLTGGIGSGKSEVSRLLRSYGATVVDADLIAREVVAAGSPGLAAVVEAFGPDVLQADGSLDRPALGRRVFSDGAALARLNEITHPRIARRTAERFRAAVESGARVVVHDVALLVENGLASNYDAVVVVAASPQTQLDRLVRLRGMAEDDARARIAAQRPLEDKLAVATHVIRNDGPLEELEPQVQAVWASLLAAAEA